MMKAPRLLSRKGEIDLSLLRLTLSLTLPVLVHRGVHAERLLLVGPGDGHRLPPPEDAAAVRRVVLEGLPRLAVVHRLEDGHVVGPLGREGAGHGGGGARAAAKVDGEVGQLVLLLQGDRDGNVLAAAELGRLPANWGKVKNKVNCLILYLQLFSRLKEKRIEKVAASDNKSIYLFQYLGESLLTKSRCLGCAGL